ncbi:MAG: Type phosphodiesterase / nucleotide pyrophosphatase [Blastocatellia bacterium]|nr:Type phosphodiesterase / nucleotide pyrophosphatase [Blastocatellia bacterium]
MRKFFAADRLRKRIPPQSLEFLKRIAVQLTGGMLVTMICASAALAQAHAKRVVMLKIDGLPYDMVERFARERDPSTGKSLLPWFDNVFFQNGTRLTNFYVRGMSLSAPSWSTLDTGQHLQIKGNVEFDRDILHTYDYLNFIPFYFKQATGSNVDMPGTEVLDSLGVPLLIDAYDNYQRFPGGQLYGRGARIASLQRAGQATFLKNPIALAGEFFAGFDLRTVVPAQLERELIDKLQDPRVEYLDLYETSFDHVAHHNNDRASHLVGLREIDGLVGRIWTAIQKSPFAADTVLILVSDHGFNTDERVISQGFNLVKLLGSQEGGGHHVITKRRLLMDYSIKSVNPFVPPISTTSSQSYYLKKQSAEYPTALLDFDGNERAGLHLRNSRLNLLHILLQQLQRKDLSPAVRRAATEAFFTALARDKATWQTELDQLDEELAALRPVGEKQRALCESQPKKFTIQDQEMGRDDNARRVCVRARQWADQIKDYGAYVATMRKLVGLRPENFDPFKLKVAEVIPEDSMGQRNSVYDLQNYVVGPGSDGLLLKTDGTLDLERSFVRINYLTLIHSQVARNNVQQGIGSRPIDFIATRIPRAAMASQLSPGLQGDEDAVWLYGGPERQALLLARGEQQGRLELRYLPIANLTQDEQGAINFEPVAWGYGLPLHLLEDPRLDVPNSDRLGWLNNWHSDVDWLHALHKTQYSNGLIGLHEQFKLFTAPATDVNAAGLSEDEKLLHRFRLRQRQLVETDMLIMANNHWNFDVRGFNPGGNHGSFFRISTHSVLMFAGGAATSIPKGLAINEPYDSLSVVPTILSLTGNLENDNQPSAALARRGFTKFPGRVIPEVTSARTSQSAPR